MREIQERNTTSVASNLCDECHTQPAKYKCPGCGIRSCSLDCVKAHKVRTSCTGKRNRSAYVPLSCFDENWLFSDYTFLEEVVREAESAKRLGLPVERPRQKINRRWTILRRQARKRKINLLYLSQGMTRRVENTSRYCIKRRSILWRIEFVFHSTDVRLAYRCAGESLSPAEMLKNRLTNSCCNVAVQNVLKQFCADPVECMRYLLVKEPSLAEQRCFVELDPSKPLGSQLTDMTIVEFPTIHVVSPHVTSNFRVVKDLKFTEAEAEVLDASQEEKRVEDFDTVEGTYYREEQVRDDEEIEEGEIVE